MIAWLLMMLEPESARVARKRRLEQIAIECGTSRQVARKIVALYFAKSLKAHQ